MRDWQYEATSDRSATTLFVFWRSRRFSKYMQDEDFRFSLLSETRSGEIGSSLLDILDISVSKPAEFRKYKSILIKGKLMSLRSRAYYFIRRTLRENFHRLNKRLFKINLQGCKINVWTSKSSNYCEKRIKYQRL